MPNISLRTVSFCAIVCSLLILLKTVGHFYPFLRTIGNIPKIEYESAADKTLVKYSIDGKDLTISINKLLRFNASDGQNIRQNISKPFGKIIPRLTKKELNKIKRWTLSISPIVVTKYKLIFFWNEKSGCTYWKSLLQFIQGIKNKKVHNPRRNGLIYLRQFKDIEITDMMFNNSWTKAVFVREPRERILSSFLDKGLNNTFMKFTCQRSAVKSFWKFFNLIKQCKDPHWSSQVRLPRHFYKNTMIGKMQDIYTFTQKLLTKIGAWNDTVKDWLHSKEQLERSRSHATSAREKLFQYYNDTKTQDFIFEMYADDYEVFKFNKEYFSFNKYL
ncbi:CHST9 [Mytilus coruscus]|uniref:Carbohydrate sulfotransferase n=1 Tax=Mytilus coruscus TaxID=42192 RepID=A0A6J8EV69_MYTCO|nr:CHST9 [Mytilus coruscus]